jgi:hypothetical protein
MKKPLPAFQTQPISQAWGTTMWQSQVLQRTLTPCNSDEGLDLECGREFCLVDFAGEKSQTLSTELNVIYLHV